MIEALTRYWWVSGGPRAGGDRLRRARLSPSQAIALTALVLLFGRGLLVDGTFTLVGAIAGRDTNKDWGFFLIGGLLGIASEF